MPLWNYIQKVISQHRPTPAVERLNTALLEAGVSLGLLWGFRKWGSEPPGEQKTFKELHSPPSIPGNTYDDDDARDEPQWMKQQQQQQEQ